MTPEEPPSARGRQRFVRLVNRQRLVSSPRKELESVLAGILVEQKVPQGLAIDISLVRDSIIHPLNRTYRGKDSPTDVLAFPYRHPKEWSEASLPVRSEKFLMPVDVELIGEVLISTDQTSQQAEKQKKEVEQIIARLAIHGLLHLLGYDHDRPETKQEMRRLERRYLKRWESARYGDR